MTYHPHVVFQLDQYVSAWLQIFVFPFPHAFPSLDDSWLQHLVFSLHQSIDWRHHRLIPLVKRVLLAVVVEMVIAMSSSAVWHLLRALIMSTNKFTSPSLNYLLIATTSSPLPPSCICNTGCDCVAAVLFPASYNCKPNLFFIVSSVSAIHCGSPFGRLQTCLS